jgi:hypothetical protein
VKRAGHRPPQAHRPRLGCRRHRVGPFLPPVLGTAGKQRGVALGCCCCCAPVDLCTGIRGRVGKVSKEGTWSHATIDTRHGHAASFLCSSSCSRSYDDGGGRGPRHGWPSLVRVKPRRAIHTAHESLESCGGVGAGKGNVLLGVLRRLPQLFARVAHERLGEKGGVGASAQGLDAAGALFFRQRTRRLGLLLAVCWYINLLSRLLTG